MFWTILAYSPDINEVTDAVVVQSGLYVVFEILLTMGLFIGLVIIGAVVIFVLDKLLGSSKLF